MHMFENKELKLVNGKQQSALLDGELYESVGLAIELIKSEDKKVNIPAISEITGIGRQKLYRDQRVRALLGTQSKSHVRKIDIGVINGKILSRRRETLGFSQRDLAKKIGEGQSYVSIAENQG